MNFITKKHLSRRTFPARHRRDAGAAVSRVHAAGADAFRVAGAVPKTRLAFIFYPHGVTMDKWLPATEGTGFEFTPILKPLEPFRDYINVVSNTYAPTGLRRGCVCRRQSQPFVCGVPDRSEAGRSRGRFSARPWIRWPQKPSARTRRCRRLN